MRCNYSFHLPGVLLNDSRRNRSLKVRIADSRMKMFVKQQGPWLGGYLKSAAADDDGSISGATFIGGGSVDASLLEKLWR